MIKREAVREILKGFYIIKAAPKFTCIMRSIELHLAVLELQEIESFIEDLYG